MLADQLTGSWGPSNEAERVAVREQLEKLLLDSHFSSSKRYPSFLRFVLEHTLAGESELLKERTLGIEIFGRPPDYDTAARGYAQWVERCHADIPPHLLAAMESAFGALLRATIAKADGNSEDAAPSPRSRVGS